MPSTLHEPAVRSNDREARQEPARPVSPIGDEPILRVKCSDLAYGRRSIDHRRHDDVVAPAQSAQSLFGTSLIRIVSGPESAENGSFAWIMDPDGNKVELWEPKAWDAKNKEA